MEVEAISKVPLGPSTPSPLNPWRQCIQSLSSRPVLVVLQKCHHNAFNSLDLLA
jgi:hypothetical protein